MYKYAAKQNEHVSNWHDIVGQRQPTKKRMDHIPLCAAAGHVLSIKQIELW